MSAAFLLHAASFNVFEAAAELLATAEQESSCNNIGSFRGFTEGAEEITSRRHRRGPGGSMVSAVERAPVGGPGRAKTSSPEVLPGGGDPRGVETTEMAKVGVGWLKEGSN